MDSQFQIIPADQYTIYLGSVFNALNEFISSQYADRKIFILGDSNTLDHCLPVLDFNDVTSLKDAEVLEVEPGEESKSVEVLEVLWKSLIELEIDRKSLVINLGGGMVSDLGGFMAGTIKRGVDFINIPTTLLSMVDASVGGKVGVNLAGWKNQVGIFVHPKAVYVDPVFLETLPKRELIAGTAEVYKHALIYDADYWELVKYELGDVNETNWESILLRSITIKNEVVQSDFKEEGLRKILNFGHTIGHAFESWSHLKQKPLLHGEAVAAGMWCEALLSNKLGLLDDKSLQEILQLLENRFDLVSVNEQDISLLVALMYKDKKNEGSTLNFSLIQEIGKSVFDQVIPENTVVEAIQAYIDR